MFRTGARGDAELRLGYRIWGLLESMEMRASREDVSKGSSVMREVRSVDHDDGMLMLFVDVDDRTKR